jgi:hypothetical protein
MTTKSLLNGAIFNGAINAIINGLITWFTSDKENAIKLTSDSISSVEHTVLAGSVPLAVSLAFILSTIAYFTFKVPNKPKYFPTIFILSIKHSIYAFGIVVVFAILLQRLAGTVLVSPLVGSVIAGAVAGLVASIVDYETKSTMLKFK